MAGNHLNPWRMIGKPQSGNCETCATVHTPANPHNAQSFFYQYKFFDQHGRWPNWLDAMAHCDAETQAIWIRQLEKSGVDVKGGKVNPDKKGGSYATRGKT